MVIQTSVRSSKKKISFGDFKEKDVQEGTPLCQHGNDQPNDMVSPDFSDWTVQLSDTISWTDVKNRQ